jgi:hypothetical protein
MSSELRRGRPRKPDGNTETVSVRLPSNVFDVLCGSALANRKPLAELLRDILSSHANHAKVFTLAGRKPRHLT